MENLIKGQKVIVVGIGNNSRYGTPIHDGIVTSIGRKWFKVSCQDNCNIEARERFDIETGMCDGRGYMSEWGVYLSMDDYNGHLNLRPKRKEVEQMLIGKTYKELLKIEEFIKQI